MVEIVEDNYFVVKFGEYYLTLIRNHKLYFVTKLDAKCFIHDSLLEYTKIRMRKLLRKDLTTTEGYVIKIENMEIIYATKTIKYDLVF